MKASEETGGVKNIFKKRVTNDWQGGEKRGREREQEDATHVVPSGYGMSLHVCMQKLPLTTWVFSHVQRTHTPWLLSSSICKPSTPCQTGMIITQTQVHTHTLACTTHTHLHAPHTHTPAYAKYIQFSRYIHTHTHTHTHTCIRKIHTILTIHTHMHKHICASMTCSSQCSPVALVVDYLWCDW